MVLRRGALMYLLFIWRGMQHHYEGHWKGLALKILTFLGPEMAKSSLDFQGPPLPMPLIMMLHASKPLHTAPYKQQVH